MAALPSLRVAQPEDISRIQDLDHLCALQPWSVVAYRGVIGDPNYEFVVACHGDETAAFGLVRVVPPEVELLKIAVDPRYQRRGLGQTLLNEVLRRSVARGCSSCFLELRRSNRLALGFYGKNGFETVGVRPRYYENPEEDALVMRKNLASSSVCARKTADRVRA